MMQASRASAASIVTEWLDQALPYAQEVAWEPTVGSRFFAILHTAMYDAWTAYDPVAVGVVSGTTLKGLGGANNEANKREAISHAAFTVLRTLRRSIGARSSSGCRSSAMIPTPTPCQPRSGAGLLRPFSPACRDDGANEAGNFADTTGYRPQMSGAPDAWRPIELLGKRQLPTTPQWSRVMPFSLRAPINSVPFRRRPPELPNGRGKSTC